MSSKDDTLQEHQGPQDAANLADEFPSPEPHHAAIDMSHELANQAAAQAIEAAVAHAAQDGHGSPSFEQHHAASTPIPQPAAPGAASASASRYRQTTPGGIGHDHEHGHGQLTNNEQIAILRESYARNPNPSKADLEALAIRTGRPWNKIREYFRQRRNKLRGLDDLANMEEPGRATGWLQVTYRSAPRTSFVSQLNLYESYKDRFDPYSSSTALLGGQELIALACATFPGCEMAKDEGDYVLRGVREKDGDEREAWERGMEGLVEPLRGTSWLLSHYQHAADLSVPASLTQTDLYTSYATRFSALLPPSNTSADPAEPAEPAECNEPAVTSDFDASHAPDHDPDPEPSTDLSEQDIETLFSSTHPNHTQDAQSLQSPQPQSLHSPQPHAHPQSQSQSQSQSQTQTQTQSQQQQPALRERENRLLNPVELINLARMTFPKCEPVVDEQGRFVIRGLERRDWVERGRHVRPDDMFPFALANEPSPSSPAHPLTSLLKRKLAQLNPDGSPETLKRTRSESLDMPQTHSQHYQPPPHHHQQQQQSQQQQQQPHHQQQQQPHQQQQQQHQQQQQQNHQNQHPHQQQQLSKEDRELVEGLRRFRGSSLGKEVRDVCVQQ